MNKKGKIRVDHSGFVGSVDYQVGKDGFVTWSILATNKKMNKKLSGEHGSYKLSELENDIKILIDHFIERLETPNPYNEELMPSNALQSLADQANISMQKAEEYWDKAKSLAKEQGHEEEYDYITGIVKKMMGLSECKLAEKVLYSVALSEAGTYGDKDYLKDLKARLKKEKELVSWHKNNIKELENDIKDLQQKASSPEAKAPVDKHTKYTKKEMYLNRIETKKEEIKKSEEMISRYQDTKELEDEIKHVQKFV